MTELSGGYKYRQELQEMEDACHHPDKHTPEHSHGPECCREFQDQLVHRLEQEGSTGADLSPGNPWCAQAAEEIKRLQTENESLRAEVREWLCTKCNRVHPGPPHPASFNVLCLKCGGITAPRMHAEKMILKEKWESLQRTLHEEWASNHGCGPGCLYGDDGELHCNCCMTDFRRMPFDELEKCVYVLRARVMQKAWDMVDRLNALESVRAAAESILEIGKRDTSNPKYDGYWRALREALMEAAIAKAEGK